MSAAMLDADKRVTISALNETMEIKKPDGQVVGMYVPEAEYKKMLYAWAEAQCPITPEERERRRQETGGNTLAEVWKKMGVTP